MWIFQGRAVRCERERAGYVAVGTQSHVRVCTPVYKRRSPSCNLVRTHTPIFRGLVGAAAVVLAASWCWSRSGSCGWVRGLRLRVSDGVGVG